MTQISTSEPRIRKVAIPPEADVSPGDLIEYSVTVEIKTNGISQWVKFGTGGMAVRAGERDVSRIVNFVHRELDKRVGEALERAGGSK